MTRIQYTILDRCGKQNTVVDILTWIQNDNNDVPLEDNFPNEYIFAISIRSSWFVDIANYLATGKLPSSLSPREKRKVIQTIASYSWINEELYKTWPDLIIQRCVREDGVLEIIKDCHEEPCGGNFSDKRTTYKALLLGYYWPFVFKDANEYVKRCDNC